MCLFGVVAHLLIHVRLWETCEECQKLSWNHSVWKVVLLPCLWLPLLCHRKRRDYLDLFLTAIYLIVIFQELTCQLFPSVFFLKEECQLHICLISWNISPSSMSSQWQLLMLLRLFGYFFTREWNSTDSLSKYFLPLLHLSSYSFLSSAKLY